MKPTVQDVAAAARVSVGTVSRVLNGDRNVAPETAARVREAIKAVNYKRLRQRSRFQELTENQRSIQDRTIGMVLIGMSNALSTLPVVASTVHGVEQAVTAGGGNLRFANCPSVELADDVLREEFDGLILKGALQGDLAAALGGKVHQRLAAIPSVWVLGRPVGLPGDCVCVNDWRVGQLAAEVLLSRGHRRVAFLNPKADHVNFRIRGASFAERVSLCGGRCLNYLGPVAENDPFPLPPVDHIDAVVPLVDRLLDTNPRPTAVFIPADNITMLVYRVLLARKVVIGRDLSVVSCNGEKNLLAGLAPIPTSIDVHSETVGRIAVNRLAQRMATRLNEPPIDIQIEPVLIPGESVGAVKCDV